MSASQDCPDCGRFVQDTPNRGLFCECGWSKPREGGLKLRREVTEAYPFPNHLDPDEYHRAARDEIFRHHPGPRHPVVRGAYGLEPGDRIAWKRRVWTIAKVRRWPEATGHSLLLRSGDHESRLGVPWTWNGRGYDHRGGPEFRMEVLTSSHHPVCGDCGQPWPCREVDEGFVARRAVDALLRDVEREAEFPVKCPVGCSMRFKTERGAAQHVKRSRIHRGAP